MSDISTAWEKERVIQSQTEQNRKRRKREGRGDKCQKQGMTVMHKGCISSRPQGTKNIVSVNGSCWSLTHGECSEKAGRLAWALAWSKRGVLRSLMRILEHYDSRRLPLERIWTCCHFWLSSACDVEAPLGCFLFTTLPLPVQRLGYGPVWRRRASSSRWRAAAAVWRAEPVNNSMGAKQMKW